MSLASPFANGATPLVSVFAEDPNGGNDLQLFSANVGATSSNSFADTSGGEGAQLTLTVDADGVISLTSSIDVLPGNYYYVLVAIPAQVTACELDNSTAAFTDSDGILKAYADSSQLQQLSYDGGTDTWVPNPYVFNAIPTINFGLFSQLFGQSSLQITDILQFQPMCDTSNPATSYNCDCDDDFPTETLGDMTRRIIVLLGYAALTVAPPGMTELVQDFLIQAQKLLFRQYKCFRTERWFTWDMPEGQRFFDFGDNNDECNKKLDPRLITWVGVSQGDNNWRELISGINPVRYTSKTTGLSQWFEVRQCIEVWPAMADSTWSLRIKGIFGLLPFASADDVTTIDSEAIFMLALGNAKAHYGQADAGNSISQLRAYIGFLTAGNQPRRRFFPGDRQLPNAVPPKIV